MPVVAKQSSSSSLSILNKIIATTTTWSSITGKRKSKTMSNASNSNSNSNNDNDNNAGPGSSANNSSNNAILSAASYNSSSLTEEGGILALSSEETTEERRAIAAAVAVAGRVLESRTAAATSNATAAAAAAASNDGGAGGAAVATSGGGTTAASHLSMSSNTNAQGNHNGRAAGIVDSSVVVGLSTWTSSGRNNANGAPPPRGQGRASANNGTSSDNHHNHNSSRYTNGAYVAGAHVDHQIIMELDENDESDDFYDDDDDDDDDDDQLTQEFDSDPFNVDQYKMLHFPGATVSRGRNIAQILADRSMRGHSFARHSNRPVGDTTTSSSSSMNLAITTESHSHDNNDAMSDSSGKTERAPSPTAFASIAASASNSAFHSPHPTHSNSDYLSPPPHPQHYSHGTSNSNLSCSSPAHPSPQYHYSNNKILANSSHHPGPQNIISELRAFVEYSSTIRFRASYLRHLNGLPPILPPRTTTIGTFAPGDGPSSSGRNRNPSNNANNEESNNNNNNDDDDDDDDDTTPLRETLLRRLQREQREMQQNIQHHHHPSQRHRLIHPRGFAAHPPPHNNNNNNNNQNNAAVSTISIAFSPDGRSLASTHGDHTVKITCAHTGKLIRQLEGHPRTPWTVKYHPTNSRIVASGCLGFQVRVWDWNFQTEGVRRSRKRERERKWSGRYDCEDGKRGGSHWSRGGKVDSSGNRAFDGGCCSPRGVVERGVEVDGFSSTDGDMKCGSRNAAEHLLPVEEDDDDYAAYVLATMGIPSDDPAWYDCEAEAFNYDDGLGVCLNMIRLNHAIISLNFHPSGEVLAVASGNTLHLWDYDEEKRKKRQLREGNNEGENHADRSTSQSSRPLLASSGSREPDSRVLDPNRERNATFPRGRTVDFRHDSPLRCVHFPPGGDSIIVGGVNPHRNNEGLPGYRIDPRGRGGMSGGGMSFHLRLWDFDLDAVLNPTASDIQPRGGRISEDGEISWNFRLTGEALSNPRIIIPRVLLYNDGGFDLSQDGKVLSACAEYWLPDGVDNAMELLQSQQDMDDDGGSGNEESDRSNNMSPPAGGTRNDEGATMPSPSHDNGAPPHVPDPRTPPPNFDFTSLEPPSPPGKRNIPRAYNSNMPARGTVPRRGYTNKTVTRQGPSNMGGVASLPHNKHNPHPLSVVAASHPSYQSGGGRYVPHIVTVSMDTSPPIDAGVQANNTCSNDQATESMQRHPNLGQLLMAAPLDGTKASGVTCVKLSPSAEYCLLGYGVRESILSVDGNEEIRHPVTALYNVKKGMQHVCTLMSPDDDVNIARFHPESGHGFVYGTKQGRVRVLATRPWNQYQIE